MIMGRILQADITALMCIQQTTQKLRSARKNMQTTISIGNIYNAQLEDCASSNKMSKCMVELTNIISQLRKSNICRLLHQTIAECRLFSSSHEISRKITL
jgi:hypothetical protein